jgi:hypothetical protein
MLAEYAQIGGQRPDVLRFDIYIRGFGPGKEPGAQRLARAFGLPLARAEELVRSLPRTVKRGVPQAQIERYARLLDEIGADCELRPSPLAPAQVIAIGSAGNTLADALEQDGSMMTLPPPAEGEAAWPAVPVEPFRSEMTVVGSADTSHRPADIEDEPLRSPYPGSTWLEGRSPAPGARGPNDTIVESQPPGAHASSAPPAPARAPAPAPLPRFDSSGQRAPDGRVMQMHAPTVRSFNTLTEQAAPTPSATLDRDQPWPSAPAAAQPPYAPRGRPVERTHPQASPAPSHAQPERDAPAAFPEVAPPSYPVVASMPAPVLPPGLAPPSMFPPPVAATSAASPLSQAWAGIAPAAASGTVPGASPAAELETSYAPGDATPGPVAAAQSAFELPLYGREEYALLAAQGQDAGHGAGVRGLDPPVVYAPGLALGSGRPPPPSGLPPGTALHGTVRASTRPAPIGVPVRETELPAALRWAVRIGMGLALFLIVGTLRQCRAVNDDVEQALARWEVRPSAQGGSLERSAAAHAGAAMPRIALGPVASEWLKADLHQVASGDKDHARGLVERFKAAGAVEVFVGTISDLGMTKVAGELLVQLPADTARWPAVLEVHQHMLRVTFGGMAPPSRPDGDVLRVTL